MEPPSPTSVSAQQLITAVILLLLVVVTAGMYTSSCTYCTSYICIAGQLERLISLPSSGSSFSCSSRRWSYNFDSFFYIKIFIVKLYLYILMKVIFKTNLFIWFKLNCLKVIHDLYSQCFDSNHVQNDFIYQTGGSMLLGDEFLRLRLSDSHNL
jgi:hypothetical protein